MKRLFVLLISVVTATVAAAGPSNFVEVAFVDGGENARNGSGNAWGAEVAGSAAIGEHWYAGGMLGRFDRDDPGGDIENSYLNANGGRFFSLAERTELNLEAGLWYGKQDQQNNDTNPRALELKAGVNQAVTEKLDVFATLAWVHADLDTSSDSNLRNYVWSLGLSYSFVDLFSLNFKLVDGVNGVNGQDQVLRLAGRFTF